MEQWKPYKWLWTHIGGRPWTWIMRDSQKSNPLAWLIGAITLGFFVCHKCKDHVWYMVASFSLGLLLAHLFW